MYKAYFNLNENPFSIAPDPLYLFMSERHRDALAHLQYGISSDGGFVLLTGEVGAGKTTLCRSLLEQLPADVDVAFILNPKLSVIELLETICDELHIDYPADGSIKQLVDRLNTYLLDSYASGRKTVLIIDEAQNLSVDVLEQLRLLTNLETNRYKLLQIVLLGQPELLQILAREDMRQLSQRITARFHLGPLDADEINAYLLHRLKVAGCQRQLFPPELHNKIWQLSGGLPRLINLICDRTLLGAYARDCKEVDAHILQQAANEVLGETPLKRQKGLNTFLPAAAAGLLASLAIIFWVTYEPSATPFQEQGQYTPSTVTTPDTSASNSKDVTTVSEQSDVNLQTSWPAGFAQAQDQMSAFADLARLWDIPFDSNRSDFCTFAREQGLECLARQDSLETLRKINRPAILTLYDNDGSPFYVVMTGLKEDRARFVAGNDQFDIALPAITPRWYGNYLMMWQPPPPGSGLIKPGDDGMAIEWLAQALDNLGFYEADGYESRLQGKLLSAFKQFQLDNGLTPDGILGPMTMIHFNTARNADGPRLDSRESS